MAMLWSKIPGMGTLLKGAYYAGGGAAALGIAGGTMRDDRSFFRSVAGSAWGAAKGGLFGGLAGMVLGAGAGLLAPKLLGKMPLMSHLIGGIGPVTGGAIAGGAIMGGLGATLGAFRGGLGSNKGYVRIQGMHQ